MWSRKLDVHLFEGKKRGIIKILAAEVQHNSDNKHSQASAEDITEARLGHAPNWGESLSFWGV